jgi:hypothetical protein
MPELKKRADRRGKTNIDRRHAGPKLEALKKVASRKKTPPAVLKSGPTTAENLEERFDRGENVLDYFDLSSGRMHCPE